MESIYSTDEDKYWVPAATLEELRKQQVEKRLNTYYHIEPQHVSLSSPFGEGEFGAVYKGVWRSENGSIEVAVKTLHCKEDTSTVESNGEVQLLKEAAVMGQFNHTNVVALHGVVDTTNTVRIPTYIASRHAQKVNKKYDKILLPYVCFLQLKLSVY